MDETIYYQGYPSWCAYWFPLLVSGIFLLFMPFRNNIPLNYLIAFLIVSITIIYRFRKKYTVTNMRVIMRWGLIANNTNEIDLINIQGMSVRQNVYERLLGIGSLSMASSADNTGFVLFESIRNPVGIRDMIRSIR